MSDLFMFGDELWNKQTRDKKNAKKKEKTSNKQLNVKSLTENQPSSPHNKDVDKQYQGTDEYDNVDRQAEDLETEKWARLADAFNNRLYYKPAVYGKDANKIAGGITSLPKIATVDTRTQKGREEFENLRRNWNAGLAQEQKMFMQNLELYGKLRQFVNDYLTAEKLGYDLTMEDNSTIRSVIREKMKLNPDTMSVADWLFQLPSDVLVDTLRKLI